MTGSIERGSDATTLGVMRERSKQLLGGQYRAEVASTVAAFGDAWFTKPDLVKELPNVPESCINKELVTLQKWGFVNRHRRTDSGHIQYSRAGFESYWTTVTTLVEAELPPVAHEPIRQLPTYEQRSRITNGLPTQRRRESHSRLRSSQDPPL